MMTTKEFQQAAEAFIDAAGIDNAIGELAEICRHKSAHVFAYWQDAATADEWERLAKTLMRLSVSKRAMALSGR